MKYELKYEKASVITELRISIRQIIELKLGLHLQFIHFLLVGIVYLALNTFVNYVGLRQVLSLKLTDFKTYQVVLLFTLYPLG